ncbi:MAG: CapA family protein [Lachnospiraceae bacterium]|nr:CapA family protein [Lachnospiraceae bacterium]
MKLMIGADVVPTKANTALFEKGDGAGLVGSELLSLLHQADAAVINLEVPLTDHQTPIEKHGPALRAATSCIEGYKALGITLAAAANNHILDQGTEGLFSTIRVLDEAGIAHVGAGENLAEAAKPYILQKGNESVGVIACAEHEFSIAGEKRPGANPFDPLTVPDQVAELKKNCDHVIVLYHGGKELYRYPSPQLQKTCRKLVEKGADLVICQHSHCIGCEEKYQGGRIIYGQGNLLFDLDDHECWLTGLLLEVDTEGGLNVTYHPVVKNGHAVRLAEGAEAAEILDAFRARGEEIRKDGFIEENYRKFAAEMFHVYENAVFGKRGFATKVLNRLSGGRYYRRLLKNKYTKAQRIALENFIECEAHRELWLEGLKNG